MAMARLLNVRPNCDSLLSHPLPARWPRSTNFFQVNVIRRAVREWQTVSRGPGRVMRAYAWMRILPLCKVAD